MRERVYGFHAAVQVVLSAANVPEWECYVVSPLEHVEGESFQRVSDGVAFDFGCVYHLEQQGIYEVEV